MRRTPSITLTVTDSCENRKRWQPFSPAAAPGRQEDDLSPRPMTVPETKKPASADLIVVEPDPRARGRPEEPARTGTIPAPYQKEARIAAHQTGQQQRRHPCRDHGRRARRRPYTAGRRELTAYCDEKKEIPYERCGKVVVAAEEDAATTPRSSIDARVQTGCRTSSSSTRHNLPSSNRTFPAFVPWSPTTAIVDFRRVAAALADEVKAMGGAIRTEAMVVGITMTEELPAFRSPKARFRARNVITCGDLTPIAWHWGLYGRPGDAEIVPLPWSLLLVQTDRPGARSRTRLPSSRSCLSVSWRPPHKADLGRCLGGPNAVLGVRPRGIPCVRCEHLGAPRDTLV